ncbi:MAG: TlpA family protein disulfide reductase [Alistipes sp.]|nr:TlpA family protein disulfide reductase [Alistipes sp.]
MRNILIGIPLLAGCFLAGCSPDTATLSGRLVGNDNRMVYLEEVLPGSQTVVDSVSTDDKGFFSLKVKLPGGQPMIYNLICRQERIPLLISPREKVKVHAVGSLSKSYTVEGSEASSEMKRLGSIFFEGTSRMDSIFNVYANAHENIRNDVGISYRNAYYQLKRDHIAFIVSNPGSLVSLYALYQRLPNDDLFTGSNDVIYYRLVADSTSKYYPDSPYVKALRQEVEAMESQLALANMIESTLSEGTEQGFPDLQLADMYGNEHSLSSLEGKVVLLDFWTVTSADNRMLNAELRQVYDKYKDHGFEIYQVSVDRNRSEWILAVQDQKLPWITVSDFKGSGSRAVTLYNVQQVPANFIIDRQGNIVGRDLWGDALEKRIKELL